MEGAGAEVGAGRGALRELKRRLRNDSIPLAKRLCLAKNVATTQYFPSVPKERIIAEWLNSIKESGRLCDDVLRSVLGWFGRIEEPTTELQGKVVELIAKYLEENVPEAEIVRMIVLFLESDKLITQLTAQTSDYLATVQVLLWQIQNDATEKQNDLCHRIFKNMIKIYKAVTRKVDFIIKFLDGELLETVFNFLDSTGVRDGALDICRTILFPISKKSHYVSFLQTLIKKESIDRLLEEKGDNIRSVLKIMSAFFAFPKGRTSKDATFLIKFIDAFVTSYKTDNQLVFAFFIMTINSLNIQQTYLNPTISMPTIYFEADDEKIKRNIFLKSLEFLHHNEIDLTVRLTDTLGEKLSKVEIKKNFISFLQAALMNVLKLEGKPDKTTLKIVTLSMKLDPNLIEPKLDKILPNIMISKKNRSITEPYAEMLSCLIETLFKLSRGTEFMSQMLPLLKIQLEAMNTEQFELKQLLKVEPGSEKLLSKIVTGEDLFPASCVEKYGRLTSELMLKQCGELFVSLQREFEEHCLILLAEGFVSPSVITLAEVLSAILCSVLTYNKMADHTVPSHLAEEFWNNFVRFERELLGKFGACLLKLSYNAHLTLSFLKLCLSYSNLKLLNARYGNVTAVTLTDVSSCDIYDFSAVLPCLNAEQWASVAGRVNEMQDGHCAEVLNKLQLVKIMVFELLSTETDKDIKRVVKTHLIKELSKNFSLVERCPFYAQVLFHDLDKNQVEDLSRTLVNLFEDVDKIGFLENAAVANNTTLLTSLAMETLKKLLKIIENECYLKNCPSLRKAISKDGFDFLVFVKSFDVTHHFEELTKIVPKGEGDAIFNALDVLKKLKIDQFDESNQLLSIYVILALKKTYQTVKSKKINRSIDSLLLSIFEISPKIPDLFKIFPVKYMFNFEDNKFLNLIMLSKIKTANQTIVVKALLESAVKKVKTDSEVVRSVVKILLAKQKIKEDSDSGIEFFSDKVFQIACTILPIIAKEKKSITTSAYRSILAELQEKLHKSLLKTFKNINFDSEKSLFLNKTDINLDDSVAENVTEGTMATLNAIDAYTLTLCKYCESGNVEDSQNLECLLVSLEYFVGNAIAAIKNPQTKHSHVDASTQLLNVILRNIRKLATHAIFQEKDQLFNNIWQCLKSRLLLIFDASNTSKDGNKTREGMDDLTVAVKLLCELCSVDFFAAHISVDLANFMALKAPSTIIKDPTKSVLTSHKVAKFLWNSILKANVIGPKSAALSKAMYRSNKNLIVWLRTHYVNNSNVIVSLNDKEIEQIMISKEGTSESNLKDDESFKEFNSTSKSDKTSSQSSAEIMMMSERSDDEIVSSKIQVEGLICEIVRLDLDALSEVIINAKKISLNFRFMDVIFEVLQLVNCLTDTDDVYMSLSLYESVCHTLNCLLLSREELLEDRWPCYLQCYRSLVLCLCQRSSLDVEVDRALDERFAEAAHSLEKLTQAICKRKAQISRLAAYLVADVCSTLERTAPSRMVRQRLENAVALLIQVSESTYAMSFLRRALAGNPGQMTMTNLYTMYKRYHKYVGTS